MDTKKTPKKSKKYNPQYSYFEIEINDYGCGTTVSEVLRLLKPFYQIVNVSGIRKPYEEDCDEES